MADIRDPRAFINGRWDWTRNGYEKPLPRRSQIGDIDGFLELSGFHLFIESKEWHGDGPIPELPAGQMAALKSLCRHDGQAVLLVYGCAHMNRPYYAERWRGWPIDRRVCDMRGMDETQARAALAGIISGFVEWAEGKTLNI